MPTAVSISRPVHERLQRQEFTGRTFGVHRVACNLIDDHANVITLLAPRVGHGPFSILVNTSFENIAIGDTVQAGADRLRVGNLSIELEDAPVWEPRPDWSHLRQARPQVEIAFAALDNWTSSAIWGGLAHITGADEYAAGQPTFMARLARGKEAYSRLIRQGLGQGKRDALTEGARLLAGLGPGGTPSGDDFLVGVMAAIWLLGDEADIPAIAETAAPRTAVLSAAFLRAAGRGEFIAAWHGLVRALAAGDSTEVKEAARRVESFGASSGADALDGFILAGRTLLGQIPTHRESEEAL
jgi:hypothetical protein